MCVCVCVCARVVHTYSRATNALPQPLQRRRISDTSTARWRGSRSLAATPSWRASARTGSDYKYVTGVEDAMNSEEVNVTMELSREGDQDSTTQNGELVELAEQIVVIALGPDSDEEEEWEEEEEREKEKEDEGEEDEVEESNGGEGNETIADGIAGPQTHAAVAGDAPAKRAERQPGKTSESLSFHDLSYEVTQKKFFRKLPNKVILNSIRSAVKSRLNCMPHDILYIRTLCCISLHVATKSVRLILYSLPPSLPVCSGLLPPGLNAIMGSTGSGKTT